MNEVIIIINGVRYEAVSTLPNLTFPICNQCHLCDKEYQTLCDFCNEFLEPEFVFKKSDKKFER